MSFCPLSTDQHDIWRLNQLNPKSNKAYIETVFLSIKAPKIVLSHIEETLKCLIQRHALLRSRITDNGEFFQISDPLSLELACFLFVQDYFKGWISSVLKQTIDLNADFLFKTQLAKISDEHYLCAFTGHHIIMDGFAMNALIKEFFQIYQALSQDQTIKLSTAMQAEQFLLEQSEWMHEMLEESTEYWKKQLTLPLPRVQLPTTKPRPAVKTFNGAHLVLMLDKDLSSNLRQTAVKNKVSLFMLLLAAFKVLLHRYTQENDCLIAVPCMKRSSAESQTCITHASSLLPIRTYIENKVSFEQYLKAVRTALLNAVDYKWIHFNTFYKALNLDWGISGALAIHDVVFNLDIINEGIAPDTCEIISPMLQPIFMNESLETHQAKFDLFLNITATSEKLIAVFEYSVDLFDETWIEHFSENFEILLKEISIKPEASISELAILSTQTRNKLLVDWNPYQNQASPKHRLEQLFFDNVKKYATNWALKAKEQVFDYQSLGALVLGLSDFLIQNQVQAQTALVLLLDKSSEYIISLVAALNINCVYVPLDPNTPLERLKHILNDLGQPMVLAAEEGEKLAQSLYVLQNVYSPTLKLFRPQKRTTKISFDEDIAYIIYTSGSTGYPKGVMVTHQGVSRCVCNTKYIHISPKDRFSILCDLSFDVSMFEIWGALANGALAVLFYKEDLLNPDQLKNKLQSNQINKGAITPALFHMLVQTEPRLLGNYEALIVVGDILDPSRAKTFLEYCPKVQLINGYGPTEAAIFASTYIVNHMDKKAQTVPIGKAISNTTLYVLDEACNLLPIGAIGELYIGGCGVAKGYLNNSELTEEKFIKNPFNDKPQDILYKTGDLARFLPDGNLEFIGRIGNQVKIRGHRIELGEVDYFLKQHKLVQEAAILVQKNTYEEKELVAYVHLVADTRLEAFIEKSSKMAVVEEWTHVWDSAYQSSESLFQYDFNYAGWKNSYDGLAFKAHQMREWVDQTISQILRLKPKRILEIGCGTGLLLFKLAPFCEHYLGLDLSTTAIDELKLSIEPLDWKHVHLQTKAAHQLTDIEDQSFDLLILNSVVQYFPSSHYLENVLEQGLSKLSPDGKIFLGDLCALDYQSAFAADIELFHAKDDDLLHVMHQRINDRLINNQELWLNPSFFKASLQNYTIQVHLKNLKEPTEMARFRYDLVIYKKNQPIAPVAHYFDWQTKIDDLNNVHHLFQNDYPIFIIQKVPNLSVIKLIEFIQCLDKQNTPIRLGEFKKRVLTEKKFALSPFDFYQLELESDYHVQVDFDREHLGYMEIYFSLKSLGRPLKPHEPLSFSQRLASTPLLSKSMHAIMSDIKDHMRHHVPEYMVPEHIVLLGRLPLSDAYKINRKILPFYKKQSQTTYQAPRSLLEKQLIESLQILLGIESISILDHFFELGMNSLQAIRWVVMLKQQGLSINPQDVYTHPSVLSLAKSLQTEDKRFAKAFVQTDFPKQIKAYEPKIIFLTGATGYVGVYLLRQLLRQTRARVYCLLRAASQKEGFQRLHSKLMPIVSNEDLEQLKRIHVVIGDIEKPRLDLEESLWNQLAQTVDTVYHAAAQVKHIGKQDDFMAKNVMGTQAIIAFCQHQRKKRLHHLSTVAVMGFLEEGLAVEFDENSFFVKQYFIGPYQETKYLAEIEVHTFIQNGGEATIYRIGTVGADSTNGTFQENIGENYFARMLNAIMNMGIAPDLLDYFQDFLPVNDLCEAIVGLSNHHCGCYHLYNPQGVSYHDLALMLQNLGYTIQRLDYEEFCRQLKNLANQSNKSLSVHDHIGSMFDLITGMQTNQATLSCKQTTQALTNLSIQFKKPSVAELKAFIEQGIKRGYFPIPQLSIFNKENSL